MNRGIELAVNTTILTIGRISTQCINFLLLPLYTTLLDVSDFGKYDLVTTYIVLFLPLVNWQYDQGVFRFVLDCRDKITERVSIFTTALFRVIKNSLIFGFVALPISLFYDFYIGLYLITSVFLQGILSIAMQYARGMGLNKTYSIASFLSAFLTILFNVLALTYFNLKFYGLLISSLLSQLMTIMFLFNALKLWEYINTSNINNVVNNTLKSYSIPLIPNNLAWWFLNASNRSLIAFFLGTYSNGLYSVASKFSDGFINFYNVFNLSWSENISLHFNDSDKNIYLEKSISILLKLFASICSLVLVILPFVFSYLVNEKFVDSYIHIPILMLASYFRVIVGLYSGIYIAAKDSKSVAITSVYAAIINFSVCIVLIKFIGVLAASIATLVAFAGMALFRYYDIKKIYGISINKKTILTITLQLSLAMTMYCNNSFWFHVVGLFFVALSCIYQNYILFKYGKDLLIK